MRHVIRRGKARGIHVDTFDIKAKSAMDESSAGMCAEEAAGASGNADNFRFPLSLRLVEETLLESGIVVS